MITGDFNTSVSSVISSELSNWNFKQIISYPTHIEGNLIDHCYISDKINISSLKIQQKPVYYTDHDKMHIVIQWTVVSHIFIIIIYYYLFIIIYYYLLVIYLYIFIL